MADRPASIQGVRDRLDRACSRTGARSFPRCFKELEEKRARLEDLEGRTRPGQPRAAGAPEAARGSRELIEALKADAEEASKLRKEFAARIIEFERVSSELDSKRELIARAAARRRWRRPAQG